MKLDKRWKLEAAAAVAALVLIFGAACGYSVSVFARHAPKAQAEEQQPFTATWATITQAAATHAGPGLRYAMTGSIARGQAVEVLRVQDGWCKCWCWQSPDPVWIFGEYLDFAE